MAITITISLKKYLTEVYKRYKDLERRLATPGVLKNTLERASKVLQEAWDNYDEAFSDIGTFEDQNKAETDHDALDDKVAELLSRVEVFLEPAQRQETPESDAGNGVPKTKYAVKATTH